MPQFQQPLPPQMANPQQTPIKTLEEYKKKMDEKFNQSYQQYNQYYQQVTQQQKMQTNSGSSQKLSSWTKTRRLAKLTITGKRCATVTTAITELPKTQRRDASAPLFLTSARRVRIVNRCF
jgi:hypothetical protein